MKFGQGKVPGRGVFKSDMEGSFVRWSGKDTKRSKNRNGSIAV